MLICNYIKYNEVIDIWRLNVVTFFKSQKDLAEALIVLIDSYWKNELKEDLLVSQLSELVMKNSEKVYLDDRYTSVLKQRLGKRRIELMNKILKHMGDK